MAGQVHALVDVEPSASVALAPSGALMFERLARDPNASVEKIERLMALWERSEAKKAETAFNTALSFAQQAMGRIATDATNPQTHSRYASYAALDRVLRPIYTAHGFALSFNTGDAPDPDVVRVLCRVTHRAGHAQTYKVDLPADGKGAKGGDVMTKTHATASALSYGMRYLLRMMFNVAVGEDDDDGNAAAVTPVTPVTPKSPTLHPSGYLAWLDQLHAAAQRGMPAFAKAWNEAPNALRQHLTATNLRQWQEFKAIATRTIGATS